MGIPDMANSAAVTNNLRFQMSSLGELLMVRTYLAMVELDKTPMLTVVVLV
jgi:hypothetical protein